MSAKLSEAREPLLPSEASDPSELAPALDTEPEETDSVLRDRLKQKITNVRSRHNNLRGKKKPFLQLPGRLICSGLCQ